MYVVFAIFIACGALYAQAPLTLTPAVHKWIVGLNARKDSFERLQAKLKIEAKGPGGNIPGAVPPSVRCPVALDAALTVALTDGHFTSSDNDEDFHIVIRESSEKEYLDLSYTYDKRGALVMTAIHKLPGGWAVGFQPGDANSNKFIISNTDKLGCIFEFDSADPFDSKAVAYQPQ